MYIDGCTRTYDNLCPPFSHSIPPPPTNQTQMEDGQSGELWVSGPSVAQGYWNRPEVSEKTFRAVLAKEKPRAWAKYEKLISACICAIAVFCLSICVCGCCGVFGGGGGCCHPPTHSPTNSAHPTSQTRPHTQTKVRERAVPADGGHGLPLRRPRVLLGPHQGHDHRPRPELLRAGKS